jgi:hypothetical protein
MSQRPSYTLADALARRYRALEATRQNIEYLLGQGHIPLRAAEQMYEGLFLSVFTAFEGFLEELFIGLLVTDAGLYCRAADVVPRLTIRSHVVARELVIGVGRPYVDWLPYENTEKRADLFFRGGRPFTALREKEMATERSVLQRGSVLRNAIAHKSRHSLERFEREVIRDAPLTSKEGTPAGFLRGMMAAAPAETRYEAYAAGMLTVARKIAT